MSPETQPEHAYEPAMTSDPEANKTLDGFNGERTVINVVEDPQLAVEAAVHEKIKAGATPRALLAELNQTIATLPEHAALYETERIYLEYLIAEEERHALEVEHRERTADEQRRRIPELVSYIRWVDDQLGQKYEMPGVKQIRTDVETFLSAHGASENVDSLSATQIADVFRVVDEASTAIAAAVEQRKEKSAA